MDSGVHESVFEMSTPKREKLSRTMIPCSFMSLYRYGPGRIQEFLPKGTKLADSELLQRIPLIPKSQDHGYRAPKPLRRGIRCGLNS